VKAGFNACLYFSSDDGFGWGEVGETGSRRVANTVWRFWTYLRQNFCGVSGHYSHPKQRIAPTFNNIIYGAAIATHNQGETLGITTALRPRQLDIE
jgi:hypothetical protein